MLAHANFKQRVDILSTLCEQAVEIYPNLQDYEKALKLINRAQKGRNKFMHSGLYFDEETGKIRLSAMSARGSLKIKSEEVHVSQLIDVSAIIHEAICALYATVMEKELKPKWER